MLNDTIGIDDGRATKVVAGRGRVHISTDHLRDLRAEVANERLIN
jgi:hypothetical protein